MDSLEMVIDTDVLVVGGGIAGIFSAIKAKEQGVDVTLVSKGTIGRCGQSPWAHGTMVVSPDDHELIEELMKRARIGGEYINNLEWTERIIKESGDRFQDYLAWGQPFLKNEKGDFLRPVMHGKEERAGRLWAEADGPLSWVQLLKKQLQKSGVRILEKVMIVELIEQDGGILGAIGIAGDSWKTYVFRAGATVLCAGAGSFKPVGGWPIADLTGDGHVMAYKAGAAITGKEFEDFHNGFLKREGPMTYTFPHPWVDAEGNEFGIPQGFNLGLDFMAHNGKAPIRQLDEEIFSHVAFGMSVHTAEGVWPADENCSTGIPGLYAAGDNCGTMVTGAKYSLGGSGTATASVTGNRAGIAAAAYARKVSKTAIDEQKLAQLKHVVQQPAQLKGGFSPNWVTQVLKNMLTPYYILRIKRGDRLQATLMLVEFMRDHLSPMLFARDPHELRLAHETRNMIINAEMRLRASLFRTESRGTHFREDYPRHNDPEWLAWVLLQKENGQMKATRKPVPQSWHPDLSAPLAKRYPDRFPGE